MLVSWLLAAVLSSCGYLTLSAFWPTAEALSGSSEMLLIASLLQLVNLGQTAVWWAAMAALATLRLPNIECYRVSPRPWPFSDEATVPTRLRFWALLARSPAIVLANNLLLAVPLTVALVALDRHISWGALDTSVRSFPSPLTMALQIAVGLVLEDALFFASHYTLHASPTLYRAIHRVHHEYTDSIVSAAEHAHPVEFVLGNLVRGGRERMRTGGAFPCTRAPSTPTPPPSL